MLVRQRNKVSVVPVLLLVLDMKSLKVGSAASGSYSSSPVAGPARAVADICCSPTQYLSLPQPLLGSRTAMADILPLRAVHYDLRRWAARRPRRAALRRDRRGAAGPAGARSPYNVVEIDLPEGERSLRARRRRSSPLAARGRARPRRRAGAVGARAALHRPRRRGGTRRGFFARVRVVEYGPGRIRPHERTHPGPLEDRLRLTRATRANLSPIFTLFSDPAGPPAARSRPPPADAAVGRVDRRRGHRATASGASATRRRSRRSWRRWPTPSC